jgi:hypothetical protein
MGKAMAVLPYLPPAAPTDLSVGDKAKPAESEWLGRWIGKLKDSELSAFWEEPWTAFVVAPYLRLVKLDRQEAAFTIPDLLTRLSRVPFEVAVLGQLFYGEATNQDRAERDPRC